VPTYAQKAAGGEAIKDARVAAAIAACSLAGEEAEKLVDFAKSIKVAQAEDPSEVGKARNRLLIQKTFGDRDRGSCTAPPSLVTASFSVLSGSGANVTSKLAVKHGRPLTASRPFICPRHSLSLYAGICSILPRIAPSLC
jgi:hypothetical protein